MPNSSVTANGSEFTGRLGPSSSGNGGNQLLPRPDGLPTQKVSRDSTIEQTSATADHLATRDPNLQPRLDDVSTPRGSHTAGSSDISTGLIERLAAADRTDSEPSTPTNAADARVPGDLFQPARVLAIVGDKPILVGDMLFDINERIERAAPDAPDAIKAQQRERLISLALPTQIDKRLLYVDVVKGLPPEADLDKMFESIGKSFDQEALPEFLKKQSFNSALEFDVYLRKLGGSLRQFRQAWIEDQFVKYFVSQKLKSNYEPTHAEMWKYYQEHLTEYSYAARARWQQLLIRFDRVPDKTEARRMIAELGNKVVYGASFEAVTRDNSQDLNADKDGQQGWVNKGSLAAEELDKAIFTIPVNELSDIIETKIGFHIVRVLERNEAGTTPFHEAQVDIKEKLIQQHRNKQLEDYINKLRRQIPIEIVDKSVQLPPGFLLQ